MKVTSTRSVEFPTLNWAITAGDTVELPKDPEQADLILSHPDIIQVKETKEKTIKS